MTIAIKKTPETNLKYLIEYDANEVDHPLTEWAHDPDFSAAEESSPDYWKWDEASGTILPMTDAEQLLVDNYATKDIVRTTIGEVKVSVADNMPKSTLAGNPLAVHSTYKPEVSDGSTWAIWSGAGDDLTDPVDGNGNGPLLFIQTELGVQESHVDIEFNPIYGRVWLHEAYLKFHGGGVGDCLSATIMAYGVPLQQAAYLDLVMDGDWIKYSTSGPGTGTHGFADPTKIVLIDRDFQKDGDWDYTPDTGLTPVFTGDGRYKMSDKEQVVHRFVNRIPAYDDCQTYFSMSSDETTEVPAGYFARMTAYNMSNTVWTCSVLMELYRQLTY